MSEFLWDPVEGVMNDSLLKIVDPGPLRAPINSFVVRRKADLELTMETQIAQDAVSQVPEHPTGTLRLNDATVRWDNGFGLQVLGKGVLPHGHSTSNDYFRDKHAATETSSLHSVEATFPYAEDPGYTIDWLENIGRWFVWPHTIKSERTIADSIKQLIRMGVLGTSAVCVLAGSMTWDRRWIKYEIARAVIDGRGLLTVHLNSINHHRTKGPDPRGLNHLAHMGVAKLQPNTRLPPQYYLCEMELVPDGYGGVIEQWRRYVDYIQSVKRPAWLTDPSVDHVMPLSTDAAEYDYEPDHGHRNIGSWIDKAAKQAGR